MVERWEGVIRACCKTPAKVMASLVLSHARSLQRPSKNAVLFMGDNVQGSGNLVVERLSHLETVASILLSKLGDDSINVWVVEASRFNGPFACYDGFLASMSPHGEPLSHEARDFPASRALTCLFQCCCTEINNKLVDFKEAGRELSSKGTGTNDGKQTEESAPWVPKTLLFGFSKGGVVLNQFLSEMAYMATHGMDHLHNSNRELDYSSQQKWRACAAQDVFPASIHGLLRSIEAIHYVDAGLCCHGAYQTDSVILEGVLKAAAESSSGLHIGFHGTPRQWKDPRRPWIALEKDQCIKQLRTLGAKKANSKLNVSERLYFENERPTLQMHFEILEKLQLVD